MDLSIPYTVFALVASLNGATDQLDTYRTELACERNRPANTRVVYQCVEQKLLNRYECGRPWYKDTTNFWGNIKRTQVAVGCQSYYMKNGVRNYGITWYGEMECIDGYSKETEAPYEDPQCVKNKDY